MALKSLIVFANCSILDVSDRVLDAHLKTKIELNQVEFIYIYLFINIHYYMLLYIHYYIYYV